MPPRRREGELVEALLSVMTDLAPGLLVFKHQDVRECGHPDWSVSGGGRTSWWEFKHGVPSFDAHGLQLLTCRRLARASFCRYVIWQESARGDAQRTLIVHPEMVHRARTHGTWDFEAERASEGLNFAFVADFILGVHFGSSHAR